ncbi:MAG TPA: type VI secretion system-associated FHA domain protein TagH, partial [Acetobacteraceae bacterium]|nr:type VI secretion system-associated FHA domain protein TagH [Acetobacteraceae bacterium]
MAIVLTLTGPRGSGDHDTRTLRNGTLSIGRGPGNDWVLPDPERHLSKAHCMIVGAGGHYLLTDISTNGVFVNGASERVPRNGQVELTDGDEVRLGDYVIMVSEAADAAHAPVAAHEALVPGGVRRADPFAAPSDLTPDPLGGDPLNDPFGMPAPAGFVHPIAAPPPALRPSDPFDLADEEKRAYRDPEEDLFKGVTPAEQWQGPSQADSADAPLHAFNAPRPIAVNNFDDLDIDALLGDTPPGQAPAGFTPAPTPRPAAPAPRQPAPPPPADFDDLLGDTPPGAPAEPWGEHAAPPAPVPPPPAPPAPSAAPASPPPRAARPVADATPDTTPAAPAPMPADAARLLAAFLEGAGVADLNLGPDPEKAMRAAGTVFQAMVEGVRQVLISRAAIKNEFR